MDQQIDDRLSEARRATRVDDRAIDGLIAQMVVTSENASAAHPHRKPWRVQSKVLIGAIAAVFVLGTASAAAATQPWLWSTEYIHADTASKLTLPSGKTCEIRATISPAFPGAQGTEKAIAVARTYAKTIDIRKFDLVGIRASMLKSGSIDTSGTLDYQYYQALNLAISDQIFGYITAQGFNEENGNISVGTESNCDVHQ